jgi:murein DD-endopeptidase MepM/ murein hydrolase activator NlpD
VAWRVRPRQGQRLTVRVEAEADSGTRLFHELFAESPGDPAEGAANRTRLVQSGDGLTARYELDADGADDRYVLRLQPELLRAVRWSVRFEAGPSLAFPVQGRDSRAAQSFWGADRDGGARSHQGVDIFAPRGTPVLAASDGVVRWVGENRLGGNVVFLADPARGHSLYYAHLDRQAVATGQSVRTGDTLGFVGNTGNARGTAPHLHFGVYRGGTGAIDPFPFVDTRRGAAATPGRDTLLVGRSARTRARARVALRAGPSAGAATAATLAPSTVLAVDAAAGAGWLRVRLPDQRAGYVLASAVESAERPVARERVAAGRPGARAPRGRRARARGRGGAGAGRVRAVRRVPARGARGGAAGVGGRRVTGDRRRRAGLRAGRGYIAESPDPPAPHDRPVRPRPGRPGAPDATATTRRPSSEVAAALAGARHARAPTSPGRGGPFYQLMMFPYPSAEGLHVGNLFAFTAPTCTGRFMRLQGHTVFEPLGFDAFGIHSENYALKVGAHPMTMTPRNVANFRGSSGARAHGRLDAARSTRRSPDYYQWTQWVFLQLHKQGLAYKKAAAVNWCPTDKTVLANEQVEGGLCERCGTPVEQRFLEQWFFRISDYAGRLLDNLDWLDWSETTKSAQRNWIGRSEGAEVSFAVEGCADPVRVFTTRVDTLFGATYLVLAPEHPLVAAVTTPEQRAAVDAYRARTAQQDVVSRKVDKEKTGVFTGAYAVNPATGARIPVWTADYVLMEYGTGAIMAVPGHDERDYEFARKFDLPVVRVVVAEGEDADTPLDAGAHTHSADGRLVNSAQFDGMTVPEAKRAVVEWLAATVRRAR